MDINFDLLTQNIKQQFPSIDFAFAYGSAAFSQKNYDYTKEKPILDLVFVVGNTQKFHSQNLKLNPKHYSGLGYLFGSVYLSNLQKNFMPVHYNPFINLSLDDGSEVKIKYGVIDLQDFQNDLNHWNILLLAGRTQKPIKILINENPLHKQQIMNSLETNRIAAVATSAYLNNQTTTMHEHKFYEKIVQLSYINDIRFKFKTENSNKVGAIVEGQKDRLRQLYQAIIDQHFKGLLYYDIHNEIIEINDAPETKLFLLEKFATNIQQELGGPDYKDFLMYNNMQQAKLIEGLIGNINQKYSKRLILHHAITVNPIKNFNYVLQKLKKGLKK